jgi:glycosyltransferase involved in cell wall biosynthesis
MKILLLSRYGRLGASSRVRSYQYLPFLARYGIDVTVAPLLGDDYLMALYGGHGRRPADYISAYFQRLARLFTADRYDLLWLEYELFPWLPAWVERWLTWRGIPYIVDYDDAIFHRYDLHPYPLIRRVLGRKIDHVMRGAALVLAGNDYLAQRARCAGAERVECLPTSLDLDIYPPPQRSQPALPVTVGWIGTPVTQHYLDAVAGVLEKLYRETGTRVILIGAGEVSMPFPCEVRPWSEATEVADLQTLDIGIMPLSDTPWERGKCGYKLIQYMACGKPVVASPVGINMYLVKHGVNGLLATTEKEWEAALRSLIGDAALRERMGQAGRHRVEQDFSVQANERRLADILMQSHGRI